MFTLSRVLRNSLLLYFAVLLYRNFFPTQERPRLGQKPPQPYIMSDPLVDWVKDRLTLLYEQSTELAEKEQSGILESFFDTDAHLIHNHKPTTLSEFGDDIRASSFASTKSNVEWKTVLSLSEGNDDGAAGPQV